MKSLLISFAFMAIAASMASAGPILVCDPSTDKIDYYVVTGLPSSLGGDKIIPDATKKYGFVLDLASLPVGSYTVTAKACAEPWGCSATSSPFQFSRPALSQGPLGIKLSQ